MAVNERNSGAARASEERDPALDRLYREAAEETPPAHLDAAILAAARREVGARPRALSQGLRRWYLPVSIAAVVIVSASLVILVRDEERVVALRRAEAPEAAMQRRIDEAAAARQATQAEAPGKAAREQAADTKVQLKAARDDAQPARVLGKMELEERAAPAQAESVIGGRVAAAPAMRSQPQAASSTAEAPKAQPEPMLRGTMLYSKDVKQDRPPVWQGFEKEPPEKWLARIEALKKEGRAADAGEMFAEFKRRFPGHPLSAGQE